MSTQAGLTARDRRKSSFGNDVLIQATSTSDRQNIILSEIISEGEIQGLAEGGSSIFLNGDPLFDIGEAPFVPPVTTTASCSDNSTAVTLTSSVSQTKTDEDGDLFLGVKEALEGTVELSSVGSSIEQAQSISWGLTATLTATTNIFQDTMVHTPSEYGMISAKNLAHGDALIELTLSHSRQKLVGYVSNFTSATVVQFKTNKLSAKENYLHTSDTANGNSHKIKITLFYKISAISGTSVTLASASTIAFSGKNIYFQGPVAAPGLQQNKKYPGSTYEFRTGTIAQTPLGGIIGEGNTSIPLNVPSGTLEKNVSKTITSDALTGGQKREVDRVRVLLSYPQGFYAYDESDGKDYPIGIAYRVEVGINRGSGFTFVSAGGPNEPRDRVSGIGTATENLMAHAGVQKTAQTLEFNVDLAPFQPFTDFSIRVTRITNHDGRPNRGLGRGQGHEGSLSNFPTEDKWKHISASIISSASAILTERLNFPHTAVASLSFNSKQFPNLPRRSYEVKGLKVSVPSNYITRDENTTTEGRTVGGVVYPEETVALYSRNVSTGVPVVDGSNNPLPQAWDGNLRADKVYTNNPAWVFYDILTNNRYGLGEFLKAQDIDVYSLYKIGKYCDELVPDGKGSKEPRFTANLYFQKATDAYKVLKDVATIFRGMLYWMDGLVSPIIDEAKEPIYQFSKSNVIDGTFQYESTGSKTRANQYIISWNNPASNYKLEPLIVEDRENIIKTRKLIKETAVAFGCTSEGQAIRYGRWKLWTAINQTEIVNFETGINASFLTPGDIINISDSDDFNIPFSGRVSSYTESGGNFLTLDRNIDSFLPTSGYTYELSVIIPKNAAILNQESATINGATFNRGDIVTTARTVSGGSQTTLVVTSSTTSQLNISNALDDSNNPIALLLNDATVVQERTLTGTSTVGGVTVQVPAAAVDGKTKIQLSTSLDEDNVAHLPEAIWAIKQIASTGVETLSSPKQYKILAIAQTGEDGKFAISAVEHYNAKFDSIEEDFRLSVVDPVFPPETARTTPPAPKNLRILRISTPHKEGEEVLIQWDPPDNYDTLGGFVVTHNFTNNLESVEVKASATDTSLPITNIRDNTYRVQVRTVSGLGRRSRPVTQHIAIRDVFAGGNRLHGLSQGGVCTSAIDINRSTGNVFFKKESYRIGLQPLTFSLFDGTTVSTLLSNNSSNALSISQSVASLSSGSYTGFKDTNNAAVGHLFYDISNVSHGSNDPLRLIAWKRDDNLDISYWFDADKFIADANSIWTNLSGTVAVSASSNKVVGTNTSFTSLTPGRVIKFSSTQAARVTYIESDTVLFLDRSFTSAVNAGTTAQGDELNPDFLKDFIIADVSYDPGESASVRYELKPHLTLTSPLADNSRAVVATPNVSSLMYGSDGTIKTAFDNITLKIQTVGFENPQVKVNGAGFSQTDQTAQTSFSAISSEPHSVTLHSAANDGANPITFADGALVFTVTVQEELDTSITATETVTITKAQEEAGGASRTASGYLYYQTQQANAPSAPSNSSVAYNWSTGLMSGGVIGTGATNWNQIAPTATGGTSDSKMWYIYYNVVQSDPSDSTTQPSFGTVVYAATNFTGLVRFTGTGVVADGSGNGLSFGSSGTTEIDGGNITTGTINANRISLTGKNISELTNNSGFITSSALSPYITTTAANGAYAALSSFNSLSTTVGNKQDASTAINTSTSTANLDNFVALATARGIGFKSDLVTDITTEVNGESNSTVIANFASALTSTGLALSANTPFGSASTVVGAGRLKLQSGGSGTTSTSRIMISAAEQAIQIIDGGTLRVLIGNLSSTTPLT